MGFTQATFNSNISPPIAEVKAKIQLDGARQRTDESIVDFCLPRPIRATVNLVNWLPKNVSSKIYSCETHWMSK